MFSYFFKRDNRVVTQGNVNELYKRPPSITDFLPWLDFSEDTQTFTLEDANSAAAMFEIIGVPTEARPDKFMQDVQANIQTCINHTIPQKDNPFVLQVYVQDEESLTDFADKFEEYIEKENRDDPLTQHFLNEFKEHIERISNPSGYFTDNAVTGGTWSGKQRIARVFLYRRFEKNVGKNHEDYGVDPESEINEVAAKFMAQMQSTGIKAKRCKSHDLKKWLTRWFNPKADIINGDVDALISLFSNEAGDSGELPFGVDLSSQVMFTQPESDAESGTWLFDNMPHRTITIDAVRRKPDIGHLTGERKIGENLYAVFDKFPTGSILSFTVVIQPQDLVENKVIQVLNASKGETAEAMSTERDASRALELMSSGDYLYPTIITVFLRGDDLTDLQFKTNEVNALLLSSGLHPIREKDDLLPINTYIKMLPMNYEPAKDNLEKKSRLIFSSDLAKLLPFYGRSRGTGNPGMIFYNRGAEPLVFDPLNKKDRSKNAFGLVLGPPGSGKSSLMVYLLLLIISIHKARIFIIEKGGSFKLLGDYCRHFGLTVNQVTLHPKHDISLPPFSDAFLMLDKEEAKENLSKTYDDEESLNASDESDDNDEERDLLGEMELKARVMITGGDPKEEDQMTRADRLTIRRSIIHAAIAKRALIEKAELANKPLSDREKQVLTEDVVAALNVLANDETMTLKRRERARDMADAMELYCSGTAGHFFNRPGKAWPEADITILEMGILGNEGYEDQLALAFMGLVNQINAIAERDQYQNRPIFTLGDEAHLITTNMLLAIYLVKIVKMWRKLGAWLWLATQNMEDFPDAAKKLLSMFEWWFAMVCPKEQIEQIARFKDLTDEQKTMLLAAHKEPGSYTEGVVIADKIQALFRNVPPPLALALAMTEKHEKQERYKIMQQNNCSELEAVFEVAKNLVA